MNIIINKIDLIIIFNENVEYNIYDDGYYEYNDYGW